MFVANSLTSEELRVLACLIEKSYTTPDQYPLSTNALTTACNQKTSREPVVEYSPQQVDQTLQLLRDAGWVRMIRTTGSRAFKHRHIIDEKLDLTIPQQAVIAVLALRGPQSPGELKTRTERYHPFEDLDAVERVLTDLSRRDVPLTQNVGRGSGQSQDRWIELLGQAYAGGHEDSASAAVAGDLPSNNVDRHVAVVAPTSTDQTSRDLEDRIAELERRLARLEQELGLDEES